MRATRQAGLRLTVHAVGLLPLALIVLDARLGHLTANPVQEVTLRTGKSALLFLTASLAVTPAVTVLGWRWLTPYRRTLGLYAFLYGLLHFLTFSWLDYDFNLSLLSTELAEKRYVLVGFAAFLILLPLAITSTKGWQKRLGRNWKRLHQWVYVAALLVVVHYVWLVKSDIRQPLAWGAFIVLLLALRRPAARRWVSAQRARQVTPKRTPSPRAAVDHGDGQP